MSRPISPGDFVRVNNRIYTIQQIEGSRVWIRQEGSSYPSLLVPFSNGQYYLYQTQGVPVYPQVYSQTPEVTLTQNAFLDAQILSWLSDPDLNKICELNPRFCENEELWRLKIVKRFGPDYLDFLKEGSYQTYQTYQTYYSELAQMNNLSNYESEVLKNYLGEKALEGKVHLLEAGKKWGFLPEADVLGEVLRRGLVQVEEWLENNLTFKPKDTNFAIYTKDREALIWLLERSIFPEMEYLPRYSPEVLELARPILDEYGISV